MPRTRKARAIKSRDMFDLAALLKSGVQPRGHSIDYAWDFPSITAARNLQLSGNFSRPATMAKFMKTDDAIFSAWQIRLSPEAALALELTPANGERGIRVSLEADSLFGDNGTGLRPEVRQDILSDMATHGLGISCNRLTPREDGSRIDISVEHWPIEHVHYDTHRKKLVTMLDPSGGDIETEINHGDGFWTVYSKSSTEPWAKHAAILPAALVWSRHAFSIKDWTGASYSHGNAKITGELPADFAYQDDEGALSAQAQGFVEILKALTSSESLAGLIPPGAKIDVLANPGTMHAIWNDLVNNAERAAQRIYCGTDASLGSPGGAPGVDILSLFGVSNTIGEGDCKALARGYQEGVIDVWTAINFGDSSLAPRIRYLVPNPDEQAEREGYATRMDRFLAAITAMRSAGIIPTPEYLDYLAGRYAIDLPPTPDQPTPDASTEVPEVDAAS